MFATLVVKRAGKAKITINQLYNMKRLKSHTVKYEYTYKSHIDVRI